MKKEPHDTHIPSGVQCSGSELLSSYVYNFMAKSGIPSQSFICAHSFNLLYFRSTKTG